MIKRLVFEQESTTSEVITNLRRLTQHLIALAKTCQLGGFDKKSRAELQDTKTYLFSRYLNSDIFNHPAHEVIKTIGELSGDEKWPPLIFQKIAINLTKFDPKEEEKNARRFFNFLLRFEKKGPHFFTHKISSEKPTPLQKRANQIIKKNEDNLGKLLTECRRIKDKKTFKDAAWDRYKLAKKTTAVERYRRLLRGFGLPHGKRGPTRYFDENQPLIECLIETIETNLSQKKINK